jgi:hypothetical protein
MMEPDEQGYEPDGGIGDLLRTAFGSDEQYDFDCEEPKDLRSDGELGLTWCEVVKGSRVHKGDQARVPGAESLVSPAEREHARPGNIGEDAAGQRMANGHHGCRNPQSRGSRRVNPDRCG